VGRAELPAGFVVEDAGELPARIGDYVEKLVGPYFEAIAEWYGALRIGQTGGALQEIIDRRLGDPFFGIFLNPGTRSISTNGSTRRSRRIAGGAAFGHGLPGRRHPGDRHDYFTTNIEDGIALADASLRDAFAAAYPEAWARIGLVGGSWPIRSGSSCTRTCCRSPTSRRTSRHSCWRRGTR
jgi:hypothetical protein